MILDHAYGLRSMTNPRPDVRSKQKHDREHQKYIRHDRTKSQTTKISTVNQNLNRYTDRDSDEHSC